MGFSIRDGRSPLHILKGQSGQGIVEYVLVLIVAVSLILGGMYQLNTAFKSWATNYFGDYLSCLLETGELPSISGTGGDSGLCNEMFKPFSMAEGRPLRSPGASDQGGDKAGSGGGSREKAKGGSNVAGGGGGGGYGGGGSGGRFRSTLGRGGRRVGSKAKGAKSGSAAYTGNTQAGDYGSGYTSSNRMNEKKNKSTLDNKFAFEDDREKDSKRKPAATFKKPPGDEGGRNKKSPFVRQKPKAESGGGPDSGMALPDFLRYLLIAAMIIGVVFFLGSQAVQIGKSMDGK